MVASMNVRAVGEYIRNQRVSSRLSLKKMSGLAGVSIPYLSQVERGLRKPSADILQAIAPLPFAPPPPSDERRCKQMATTKSSYDFKKALTDYTVYVPLGATQVFIEKAKELPGKARSIRLGAWRDNVTEMYQDLAQRG